MWRFYNVKQKIRYIKYCLILFTCLFVLSGISFIVLGTTINAIYNDYSHFLHMKYFSPSMLLTAIGFIIFIIACLGLFGAIQERPGFILAFGFCLGVLFILQMTAGFTNYFLLDGIDDELASAINNTMYFYNKSKQATTNMDNLQTYFHCCGLDKSSDWQPIFKSFELPASCCIQPFDSQMDKCVHPFERGCFPILLAVTEYTGRIFSIVTYCLSGMHLAGMFFAFYLAKIMREQKIAREAQKWLIREQILNNSNDYDFNIKNDDYLPPYSI